MNTRAEHTELAYSHAFELYIDDADFDHIGPALRQARAALDTLTTSAVRRAIERGRSWTSIGNSLGVTRQAAQKKYHHLAT